MGIMTHVAKAIEQHQRIDQRGHSLCVVTRLLPALVPGRRQEP
jgi:hypothetical protein